MISALGLFLLLVASAEPVPPTVDQLVALRWPEDVRLSPDGALVAVVIGETDWEENAFRTHITILETETGRSYPLTQGKRGCHTPRWSPDSRWLAFLSDRDGSTQVHVISPRGGEAVALTAHDSGIEAFGWSPDGKRLAFLAADPDSPEQRQRQEKYGSFEVFEEDRVRKHLWLVDLPALPASKPTAAHRLTEGPRFSVGDFSWSPDSRHIAFVAARDAHAVSEETSDIAVVTVADRTIRTVVQGPGADLNPHWSPDGKQIAYETANGRAEHFHGNRRLAVVPSEGGRPRLLTPDFDESPDLVAWKTDGIYFGAQQRTRHVLFRLVPGEREPVRVASAGASLPGAYSLAIDPKKIAFVAAEANEYPEVFITSAEAPRPRRLTALGDQVKGLRLGRREVVRWTATDGTEVEGVLTTPTEEGGPRKRPLLVVLHGGPADVDTPALHHPYAYPIDRFVAQGAVVLQPNYRGSAGYGEKFRQLNVRQLGLTDAGDVESGIDFLTKQGRIDPDRVGVMGWSQGGHIAAMLACRSHRFKAASVGAGIADWTSYYTTSDLTSFTRQYLKATPWDDPEVYRRTSPLSYVKNARTPMLLQHGDSDGRVPPAGAYALYRALKDQGVAVRLVLYKGYGHTMDRPREQRALMEQNEAWFREHLWGEKEAPKK